MRSCSGWSGARCGGRPDRRRARDLEAAAFDAAVAADGRAPKPARSGGTSKKDGRPSCARTSRPTPRRAGGGDACGKPRDDPLARAQVEAGAAPDRPMNCRRARRRSCDAQHRAFSIAQRVRGVDAQPDRHERTIDDESSRLYKAECLNHRAFAGRWCSQLRLADARTTWASARGADPPGVSVDLQLELRRCQRGRRRRAGAVQRRTRKVMDEWRCATATPATCGSRWE